MKNFYILVYLISIGACFTLQFINLSDPILEEEEIGYNTLSARTQVISIERDFFLKQEQKKKDGPGQD